MTTEAKTFSSKIKNFLKKEVCWSILFLFILFIGSASISIGHRLADNIQSEYGEIIALHQTNLSKNLIITASAAQLPKADSLTPIQAPRPASPPANRKVTASWYGEAHHNKLTASGQKFEMHKYTLAHRTLPMGTRVRLVNPQNGKSVEGIVNDRGPYIKGRDVDVSYVMAKQLGFVNKGVMKLLMERI
jgi:rare lipoprotein A (peptidoglycan hydrolase)